MRRVSALPLRAVGFGRDRTAAGMCLEATHAALRTIPDYARLCDLLRREIGAEDLEGPTLRFLQALVDETAEATLLGMGLDEPDMVSVLIDVDAITAAASFEFHPREPYDVTSGTTQPR
jgi:hypothetical protein